MGKALNDSQIEKYHRDGFLFPIEVMKPEEAATFREMLENTQAEGKLTGSGQTKFYLRFPWVHELATRPSVLDPCLLYTSPSPRDQRGSRMPSSA